MITRSLPEGRDALAREVRAAIRDVPDFPKPGIIFKDITPVLSSASLFRRVTDSMAAGAAALNISHVVADGGNALGVTITSNASVTL